MIFCSAGGSPYARTLSTFQRKQLSDDNQENNKMNNQINDSSTWKGYEKILFRLSFVYFLLQIVPLDWKYYRHLLNINWLQLSFRDIFNISKYTPQFISGVYNPDDWGLGTFADWGLILALAVLATILWTFIDQKHDNYNKLLYWLRVLVRYRLGAALIAYGLLKVFAVQAPYPSLSSLNTPYGDFSAWKLFSLSLGIVPGYQSFLGAVELIAGLLLLNRKTATIGATIVIFFTGNVFMSNLAYEGGEVVYSFYLVTLALFLVAYDLERILSLIILRKPVQPAILPVQLNDRQRSWRIALKVAFIAVFVVLNGIGVYRSSVSGGYHFPQQEGVRALHGLYTVTAFEVNGRTLPYSMTDPSRWQNVVFERWATFSVKINKPYTLVNHPIESIPDAGIKGRFERDGTVGRTYYTYKPDIVNHQLILLSSQDGREVSRLNYALQPDSSVLLTGSVDGNRIKAILKKDRRKYLLKETSSGRRKSLKL